MTLPITKLLDTSFMTELFWENKTQVDKRICSIISLSAKKIKYYDGDDFQHAVVQYELQFYDNVKWKQYTKIYASAHSDGSRKSSFEFMKHIHDHGFDLENFYSSTKPLFYDKTLKASFHQELMGENVLYIIEKYPDLLPEAAKQAAHCLALFHNLPIPEQPAVHSYPFSLKHIDPSDIIKRTNDAFAAEKKLVHDAFEVLQTFKQNHSSLFEQTYFSHGDFHLENIIIGTDFAHNPLPFGKVGIIDYTDVCQADRGLDIGSITQKLYFASEYKLQQTPEESRFLVDIFINEYVLTSHINITPELQTSIIFWQTWNALRVLVNYFLFPEKNVARSGLVVFIQNNITHLKSL